MQPLLRSLLALCLAHLLGDFLFQSKEMVRGKLDGKLTVYIRHGVIHYFFAIAAFASFIPGSIRSLRLYLVVFALILIHLVIDYAKMGLTNSRKIVNGSRAFAADQFLHVVTILVAAGFLIPAPHFTEFFVWLARFRGMPNKFLAVPVAYVAVVFGGGYLVRFLTRSLAKGLPENQESTDKTSEQLVAASEQLANAGLYIGYLERFLVVTALLLQSPATVGLILTAKSIARYPEFKKERFAEYFLIGTLLSISLAIVAGAILAKVLYGQVRL